MSCFECTLDYTAPSHGDWGIVRVAALVPESHLLFASPAACGRHGALGAIQHGYKDRVSYLALTQQDIIDGYDGLIEQAADELLRRKKPKCVLIYTGCINDLVGIDMESLCERLRQKHPGVAFQPAYMNPITLDSRKPPMQTTQKAIYDFLEPSAQRDGGVNLIGNHVALRRECELFRVLAAMGAEPVRHMSDYATFADWQQMARSRANLLVYPIAKLAADSMKRRLGQPYLSLPVSYELDEIDAQYAALAAFMGAEKPDLSAERDAAETAFLAARRSIGGRPVWVTGGPVLKPFGLAKALLEHGFTVEAVVAQAALGVDRAAFDWVLANHPEVKVLQTQHTSVIDFAHRDPDVLAIGFDAAYMAGTGYVAAINNDEGNFGYDGVRGLMALMTRAASEPRDLRQMIAEFGAVI